MKYLLSISIGPVQDFIAAARRTRDLQTGSWLLSELSKAVAAAVSIRGELIFPYSANPEADLKEGSDYAVANRILAVIEADNEPELRVFARELEQCALSRLMAVGDDACEKAPCAVKRDGLDKERMKSQLDNFIEFYAAWAPFDESRYPECRNRVECWAAARKSLRDFAPHNGAAKLPKSSLDGIRETVVLKNGLRDGQFHVKPNEQLDAIGVVKRFARGRIPFDSTIDVAAGPYVARLKRSHRSGLELYEAFLKENERDIPFSYGYLYGHESRGPEKLPEPYASNLEELLRSVRFPQPAPPYYAFLLGDGDSMGEAISGIWRKEDHQDFSMRLSGFARAVAELAKAHEGWKVVFAGGDDVMALLPLHEALDAAIAFRNCFRDAMSDSARSLAYLKQPPTMSCGMVIVHALEPLSTVREMAKTAERAAKAVPGKDALAIIAVPRSGVAVTARGPWDEFARDLNSTVELYRTHSISPGFAYALRNLLDSTLRRKMTHLDETLFPLARALAEKKDAKAEFLRRIDEARQRAESRPGADSARAELRHLTELLLVARPMARAVREAQR
jgi:CRISPR-associated protein Cmr2